MKYCVAKVYFEEGKPYVQFRAKSINNLFYWTSNIYNEDVIWRSKEEAERFCKLKPGRTLIPQDQEIQ